MKRTARRSGVEWFIGLVALAVTVSPASAQKGPDGTVSTREGAGAIDPAPSLNFANRLASTVVFIENKGQFDPRVKFQANVRGRIAWLTANGVTFDVVQPAHSTPVEAGDRDSPLVFSGVDRPVKPPKAVLERLVFSEDLVGSSCCSIMEGKDPQPGVYNYFQSSDSKEWRTNVHGFAEVIYHDVWPGIDLRIYGHGADLEQEFIVQPAGDFKQVQVSYRGIDGLHIGKDGSMEVATAFGILRETKPRLYQQVAGRTEAVAGQYRLLSQRSYGFDAAGYRAGYALVVDPTLLYSTFLGGGTSRVIASYPDVGTSITVDALGDSYVAGYTGATDFPTTPGAFEVTDTFTGVPFVTKLNAAGSALVYSTYLGNIGGGKGITAIAVDSVGNASVTGFTSGGVFPTTSNAYWPTSSQSCVPDDFFITKLNSTGDQLLYSSCLGLNDGGILEQDVQRGGGAFNIERSMTPNSIAVDSSGKVYIAGSTFGNILLPTTPNAYQSGPSGLPDPSNPGVPSKSGFLLVFDTTASGSSSLIYSSYFGLPPGTASSLPSTVIYDLALDSFGKVYVAGDAAIGLPVTAGAFQTVYQGSKSAFVAKFDPASSGSQSLIYSTYLGGVGSTSAEAIAVDTEGNAYVSGLTTGGFPVTPGAFQTSGGSGFVTKLDAGGSHLLYASYLNGVQSVAQRAPFASARIAMVVDPLGQAYIAGNAGANLSVTANAFQAAYTESADAFLTVMNSTGSDLVYSSYLGGAGSYSQGQVIADGVAVDQVGDVYLTGWTNALDFPVSAFAFQPQLKALTSGTAFVTKFPVGASQTLSITSIVPTSGGNSGTVSPEIFGTGFHNGAIVQLNCDGQAVAGAGLGVGVGGRTITATFDLTGSNMGVCDVIVTDSAGSSVTLSGAFTVEAGGAPNIQLYITGLEARRVPPETASGPASSVWNTTISNTGTIDSAGGYIAISADSQVSLTSVNPSAIVPPPTNSVGYAILVSGPIAAGASQSTTSTGGTSISLACSSTGGAESAHACFYPISGTDPAAFASCLTNSNLLSKLKVTASCAAAAAGCATSPSLNIVSIVSCLWGGYGCYSDTTALVDYCLQQSQLYGPPICFSAQLPCVQPRDPNDLVGPVGIGTQHWVAGSQAGTYIISFTNVPTAPVPAQQVIVDQPLGSNVDLSSLSLLGVTIPNGPNNVQVFVPAGAFKPSVGVNEFVTSVDLRPNQSLLVNVDAMLNARTQTLTWTLTSIDPSTGQIPLNPLVGFLPAGSEANLSFGVTPRPRLATGTQISEQASIKFVGNSPMTTPTWTTAVDNTPPVSAVSALAAKQTTSCFRPQWTATDVGSGVQGTAIFVSDNGGMYTPWLTNTAAASAVYNGVAGHAYAFYSQATDLVGNVEATHAKADASTAVPAGASCNGRPTIAGAVSSNTLSGTTETFALQFTNNGVGNAQNIKITSVSLRTLVGTGSVTLSSPAAPISVGSLAAGASTTETLTLNAPATVKEYSITEAGTVQDLAGNTYSFSISEAMIP
ncbi:MAG TPA: SBBP repeat-containing protein [Bryobacteraceae bacterium]|jgi:hypothetical protein